MKKELDESKSQLVILEYNKSLDIEEQAKQIQSLQQLVHETIEESTMSSYEIKRLAEDNERLKQENLDIKEAMVTQQQVNYFLTFNVS